MSKELAIIEISKRIDELRDETKRGRDRMHEMETTIPVIVGAVGKNSDQIMEILEKQKKIDDRIVEVSKDILQKISEVEKVTGVIKLAGHHWKSILTIGGLFLLLLLSSEKEIKDILLAFMPSNVAKIGKVLSHD